MFAPNESKPILPQKKWITDLSIHGKLLQWVKTNIPLKQSGHIIYLLYNVKK